MRVRRRYRYVLLSLCAFGCGDATGVDVRVEVVTPSGSDPTEGVDRIVVRVREDGGEPRTSMAQLSDGTFDLPVVVGGGLTDVAVQLSGPPDLVRVGAPPPFFVQEAVDPTGRLSLSVPVGEPGSCSIVRWDSGPGDDEPDRTTGLAFPVAETGVSLHGTFAVVAGGAGSAGPVSRVAFLDLLQLSRGTYDASVSVPAGPVHTIALSDRLAFGLGSAPFLLDVRDGLVSVLSLPDDVVFGVGVAPRRDGGAVVAGGATTESSTLLIIDEQGMVEARQLSTARLAPGVVVAGDLFFVVGGAPDAGAFWGDVTDAAAGGAVSFSGERIDPWVFASENGADVLVGGGRGADGSVSPETVWITGCPACEARSGPRWERPRLGESRVTSRLGGGWLVGGDRGRVVERVSFSGGGPVIEASGPLEVGRSAASAVELDSGVLYVAGGQTEAGFTDEVEVCFPPELL